MQVVHHERDSHGAGLDLVQLLRHRHVETQLGIGLAMRKVLWAQ